MSHYDCDNCGATMGVDFGICEVCTPREYFELKKEREIIRKQETSRLESMSYLSLYEEIETIHVSEDCGIKDVINLLVDKKTEAIDKRMKELESSSRRH